MCTATYSIDSFVAVFIVTSGDQPKPERKLGPAFVGRQGENGFNHACAVVSQMVNAQESETHLDHSCFVHLNLFFRSAGVVSLREPPLGTGRREKLEEKLGEKLTDPAHP
jgi:hypothetical protein